MSGSARYWALGVVGAWASFIVITLMRMWNQGVTRAFNIMTIGLRSAWLWIFSSATSQRSNRRTPAVGRPVIHPNLWPTGRSLTP